MDTSPIPLLFLDEASRHATHSLRLHRFAYHPHSFPHPSSPQAVPEDLAPQSACTSMRRLPWAQLLACLPELPPGPVVVAALGDSDLLRRLPAILEDLTHRGLEIHLVLGDWLRCRMEARLGQVRHLVRSLILLPEDLPDASLAPCLEDLYPWLRSEASNALRGSWIWRGTPAGIESVEAMVAHLASILSRHRPSEPQALLVHPDQDEPTALLSAHLPLDEEPELHAALHHHGWGAFPIVTGRSCPETLRHSLRLGAFLPPYPACEESDED